VALTRACVRSFKLGYFNLSVRTARLQLEVIYLLNLLKMYLHNVQYR
jgi:hypothetical protein